MQAKSTHHIAVAVADVDEALATYQDLFGALLDHRETVPDQGVDAAMVILGGNRIELLGATSPDTPVGKFLAKRGPGIHHIAFEVDDIRASLAELVAKGATLIDAEPRLGLHGLEVAFIHPESSYGVLYELVAYA
ncbi:MAG TPA: methylmalonyl-CoA epimerase [Gaiellaceae bacterium]